MDSAEYMNGAKRMTLGTVGPKVGMPTDSKNKTDRGVDGVDGAEHVDDAERVTVGSVHPERGASPDSRRKRMDGSIM